MILTPTRQAGVGIDPAFEGAKQMVIDLLAPYSVAEINFLEDFLCRSAVAAHSFLDSTGQAPLSRTPAASLLWVRFCRQLTG